MSTIVLKKVEEYNKCIKLKNLCIKLVKKDYHYIRMQQNVKIQHTVLRLAPYICDRNKY